MEDKNTPLHDMNTMIPDGLPKKVIWHYQSWYWPYSAGIFRARYYYHNLGLVTDALTNDDRQFIMLVHDQWIQPIKAELRINASVNTIIYGWNDGCRLFLPEYQLQ